MDKRTVGLSDTFKGKTSPKSFTKNPIKGPIDKSTPPRPAITINVKA